MTVREAAVTDVLSTRWRHLWLNVDHLILDSRTFGMPVQANSNNHGNPDLCNSEAAKFVCKVNELLSRHNGNKVKTFQVNFQLDSAHASDLDRWVEFAIASHAETLALWLYVKRGMVGTEHTGPYVFPLKDFANLGRCHLHHLSLYNCILETTPANLNGFSYLNILVLSNVQVVDEVVLSIMSACHTLHYLYLKRCDKLRNLRISHAQLAFMNIYRCRRLRSVSIHAEKLESLSYTGISYPTAQWKIHWFEGMCVLTSWKKSIRVVAYLLKAAPLVETLELEAHDNPRPLKKLKIKWPRNLTYAKLSTIRITGFSGDIEMVQLVFFLLSRSPVLKTLLIGTRPHYHGIRGWKEKDFEDMRCNYAREVMSTHLIPNIPSTVKLVLCEGDAEKNNVTVVADYL